MLVKGTTGVSTKSSDGPDNEPVELVTHLLPTYPRMKTSLNLNMIHNELILLVFFQTLYGVHYFVLRVAAGYQHSRCGLTREH